MRWFVVPLLAALSAVVVALSWWPNRPVDPVPGAAVEKFNSLSFGAYRPWESPLVDCFPTRAEADIDMALIANVARATRTYAAIEGDLDTAALAQQHGVKLWQGIWLGADRASNEREMARGIALAHKYKDTIERVIVGNEVLLRRDLPPAELIADIDRVKHAVSQPVAYADVWEFWRQFPEVAGHVDVMLIHLLPYWEDNPTGIDGAIAHVGEIYHEMKALFPGKQIAIGETGWPSRGRQRGPAVPSRINEARFLREFIELSRVEHFDYNFFAAFDQTWKYRNEGTMGANWGLFTVEREAKIPLSGPLEEDPAWPLHAGLSVLAGLTLSTLGLVAATRSRRPANPRRDLAFCAAGMSLGAAFGMAAANVTATLYDVHLEIAGAVNLAGQALLAALAMLRLAGAIQGAPARTGADTTRALQALARGKLPRVTGSLEDISFIFVWTAAVMQLLLVFDPRYREFPLSSFAVPLLVTIGRLLFDDRPLGGGGREELAAGAVLVAGAVISAIQEGALNGQSAVWNACAIIMAVPLLLRLRARAAIGSYTLQKGQGSAPNPVKD